MSSEPYDAATGIHEELCTLNRNLETIIELLTPKQTICGVAMKGGQLCQQGPRHEGHHG